ncbi:hypothetical protein JCGZ_11102 [Jatropha curcas]|uniref:Uncharacterized protein n=1 Tax=Jatropha curcas TaxID=180498 RepID=A0A067KEK1_JATCU|nr:hypothetical protein JCGZ_11102 [Jatropha curcas]
MAIRLAGNLSMQILTGSILAPKNKGASRCSDVPKGCLAVYIGEIEKKRCVVPLSYLKEPLFQDLLSKAEDELGFDREDTFLHVTSNLKKA